MRKPKQQTSITSKAEKQAREVLTLDSAKFYLDTAPEEVTKLIQSIDIVQKEFDKVKLQEEIIQIARNALVEQIKNFIPQMEKVPEVPEVPEEEK